MLNKAIIKSIHRGPTVNDILPKVTNVIYLTLIYPNSGYQNLKLDKKSSYFITFACHLVDSDMQDSYLELLKPMPYSREK